MKRLTSTATNKRKKSKKKSGNKNYEKGRRFEYRVVNYYRDRGYWAQRSYASKGPFDVMAIQAIDPVNFPYASSILLLQCKNLAVEQKLSKYEADNLRAVAKTMGAKPLHAYNDKKHRIIIEEL